MTPFDKTNKEIHVNDYIVYGHALGRCAGLRIGKVLKIKEKESRWGQETIKSFSITVIGVDDDWVNYSPYTNSEPKLCSHVGHLLYPNRIIVLDKSNVPEKYIELLESYVK
jgi:hypothetical protein